MFLHLSVLLLQHVASGSRVPTFSRAQHSAQLNKTANILLTRRQGICQKDCTIKSDSFTGDLIGCSLKSEGMFD